MANMNVTYDELRSQAGQLRNGQQQMTDILHNLQSQVNNLVSSGFVTFMFAMKSSSTHQWSGRPPCGRSVVRDDPSGRPEHSSMGSPPHPW